jgi:hypothetical protein
MSKLAQQVLRNANELIEVYRRTRDEGVLEIIKSLIGVAEEELMCKPVVFPAMPPEPSRPWDGLPPAITAYGVPGIPWTTLTGTAVSSDHVELYGEPVATEIDTDGASCTSAERFLFVTAPNRS